MKNFKVAGLALMAFSMVACTAGANPLAGETVEVVKSAGFLKGLWHGFIILFTFIISLFNDNVTIYEVHNNGGWYNFGFLLGVMCFWGSSGNQSASRGKSKREKGPLAEIKEEIKTEIVNEIEKEFEKEVDKDTDEETASA